MNASRTFAALCSCALLTLAACGGPSAEETARDAHERAEVQASMNAMKQSADGSAASAVGDMMADPEIQQQLGMGGTPPATPPGNPPSVTPPPTPPVAPASSAGGMDAQMAATQGADPMQIQALATCRAMRAARSGGAMRAAGQQELAQAAADLAADANALGKCQAGM